MKPASRKAAATPGSARRTLSGSMISRPGVTGFSRLPKTISPLFKYLFIFAKGWPGSPPCFLISPATPRESMISPTATRQTGSCLTGSRSSCSLKAAKFASAEELPGAPGRTALKKRQPKPPRIITVIMVNSKVFFSFIINLKMLFLFFSPLTGAASKAL